MTNTQNLDDYANCTHAENTVVRYICSNGAMQICKQCSSCGKRVGSAIKHSTFADGFDFSTLPEFDPSFQEEARKSREAYYKEIKDRQEKEQEQEAERSQVWWAWYNDYLKTDKWHKKRIKVLARDKVCQACLDRPAVQVHHTTYKHVGNEPLFELVGVCVPCHDCITQLDRADKNTR